MTREQWLNAFIEQARAHFDIPTNVRASIGFTSKGSRGSRIGECWSDACSDDKVFEIFIKPSLQSTPVEIAATLTHELVHAAVGLEHGHDRTFGKLARQLGLEGKLTATTAGPAWHEWADPIMDAIGEFPGAKLDGSQSSGPKKQTTRMLKLTCDGCDWTCRTSAKHIADHSWLRCPTGCGGYLKHD